MTNANLTFRNEFQAGGQNLATFPESFFLVPPRLSQEYLSTVARGYLRMRQRRVVIGGLARNVGSVLPVTIRRIEQLGLAFDDYRVVIYENDSSDDTLAQLTNWMRANPKVSIVTEVHQDPEHRPCRSLSRACRMAYYRAQCQDFIAGHYRDFDDVILVDTDLEGGWSYDGIANSFGHNDWDFMGLLASFFVAAGWPRILLRITTLGHFARMRHSLPYRPHMSIDCCFRAASLPFL